MMRYRSTRGKAPHLSFEEVVMTGLASDGGLYVPESLPYFSPKDLEVMSRQSYQELATTIMQPFVEGSLDYETLSGLVKAAYQHFDHPAIVPLVPYGSGHYILELFHGPTLAFKDVALQFLGKVFNHVLTHRRHHVTIIGATSGDTGSAAIEGCRHSEYVRMFILHPKGRISDVQRRQMTTILADNVHNIAVESDFDFCQETVKQLFADATCLEGKSQFVAINSINWCRIMAQIVYYFYAFFALRDLGREVVFSVPTGNFGDIYAGFLAKCMGLPVSKLLIATNANDILHRFLSHNDYRRSTLVPTLSPSMDIQVSSNFERLLFDLYHHDAGKVAALMQDFKQGSLKVGEEQLARARALFGSYRVDDHAICQVMADSYAVSGMVVDPHTATALYAAQHYKSAVGDVPVITLATAHPAKFPEAVSKAGVPAPALPGRLACLTDQVERYVTLPANLEAIKDYICSAV